MSDREDLAKSGIYATAAVVMVFMICITSYCGLKTKETTERWKAHPWEGYRATPFEGRDGSSE